MNITNTATSIPLTKPWVQWVAIVSFVTLFLCLCVCYTYFNITDKRKHRQLLIKNRTIRSDHHHEILQNTNDITVELESLQQEHEEKKSY